MEKEEEEDQLQRRKRLRRESGLSILELPAPIICDILSRLPLKTILRCRYSCKTFRNLLSDPYFTALHFPQCLFIYQSNPNSKLSCFRFSESYVADLDTGDDAMIKVSTGLDVITNEEDYIIPTVVLVGCCNGLLCFVRNGDPINYYVSNPMLGECCPLPYEIKLSSTLKKYYRYEYGFGFCSKSNKYKLIRFMQTFGTTSAIPTVELYTLGTKLWRNINNPPCRLDIGIGDTCLNGTLHWLPYTCREWEVFMPMPMVQTFDIKNECFGQIPMPASLLVYEEPKVEMFLGLLRGCLCICTRDLFHHEVWVMSDYGVEESWKKMFAIDFSYKCYNGDLHVKYQIIKLLDNGDNIWLCNSHSLVCYSPQKEIVKVLINTVGGSAQMFKFNCLLDCSIVYNTSMTVAVAYVPNFISLKDVLKSSCRSI